MPTSPGGPDCEGIIHQVTKEPLPEQAPFPKGDQTIELSWSRTKAVMRLKVGDDEWYVKEMNGKCEPVGADPVTGRMLYRARCLILHNGGHPKAQFRLPREEHASVPAGS